MAWKTKKSEGLTEFNGKVDSVNVEVSTLQSGEEQTQYHISIVPVSPKNLVEKISKSKTKMMHEWIRLTDTSSEEEVAEGSVLHKYLEELISISKIKDDVINADTITDAIKIMEGKTFEFRAKKLGKSFGGHEAKDYWTPVNIVK